MKTLLAHVLKSTAYAEEVCAQPGHFYFLLPVHSCLLPASNVISSGSTSWCRGRADRTHQQDRYGEAQYRVERQAEFQTERLYMHCCVDVDCSPACLCHVSVVEFLCR